SAVTSNHQSDDDSECEGVPDGLRESQLMFGLVTGQLGYGLTQWLGQLDRWTTPECSNRATGSGSGGASHGGSGGMSGGGAQGGSTSQFASDDGFLGVQGGDFGFDGDDAPPFDDVPNFIVASDAPPFEPFASFGDGN